MAQVNIDRLTLTLPGGTEREGRRLAALVSQGLASAAATLPTGQLPAMRIDVPARSGESVDAMAEQIVAEILRQLHRAL